MISHCWKCGNMDPANLPYETILLECNACFKRTKELEEARIKGFNEAINQSAAVAGKTVNNTHGTMWQTGRYIENQIKLLHIPTGEPVQVIYRASEWRRECALCHDTRTDILNYYLDGDKLICNWCHADQKKQREAKVVQPDKEAIAQYHRGQRAALEYVIRHLKGRLDRHYRTIETTENPDARKFLSDRTHLLTAPLEEFDNYYRTIPPGTSFNE